MDVMYLVLFILAFNLGWFVRSLLDKPPKKAGDIMVTNDEDGIYLSLRLSSMSDVTSNKEVTFNVISQK